MNNTIENAIRILQVFGIERTHLVYSIEEAEKRILHFGKQRHIKNDRLVIK
jgi:hypothetical protein